MQINVLLFAAAKQAADRDCVSVDVAAGAKAADVMEALASQVPALQAIVASSRLAVDNCYVGPEAAITADSEVALIPPVSGG